MKTKDVCINGIGIALFVALSMCLRVPIFDNFYLCLGYVVMTIYLYSIGTISGTLIGVLGTFLYCFLINGLRGMPGWVLGNIIIGIILGLWFKFIRKIKLNKFLSNLLTIIIVLISVAIGILIGKSIIEVILYAQPFLLRLTTNLTAYISDIVVILISLPICKILDPQIKKYIK